MDTNQETDIVVDGSSAEGFAVVFGAVEKGV
jgi:hypothetical protein